MKTKRHVVRNGLWLVLQLAVCFGLLSEQPVRAVEAGQDAPDFTLTDVDGNTHKLSDYKGSYVVLEWSNPDCPFVKKHYGSGNMQDLQAEYTEKGVIWLSINSSAPGLQGNYPPAELKALLEEQGVRASAILQDSDGSVGRLYGAQTTPHIYIINPQETLLYAGAIDSIPSTDSDDIEEAENYVRSVLDTALSGGTVEPFQNKPYGCSVKYRN